MTRPPINPRALMAELARTGRDWCILCGRAPTFLGIWVPTAECSRRLGSPEGKTRAVAYGLCKKCERRPGKVAEVEDKILRQAEAALRSPAAN